MLNFPQISFIRYNLPIETELNDDDFIAVPYPKFYTLLEKLLSETENEILVNFIFWRIVYNYSPLLGVKGISSNSNVTRHAKCFSYVFFNLPISCNAYWVRHFFNRKTKAVVETIVNDVKSEFYVRINESQWMDEDTRKIALKKVKDLKVYAAYPEEFFDDEKVMRIYENITIDEKKFFEAYLMMQAFDRHETFKNLNHRTDKENWILHSYVAVINAFYFNLENYIHIPAAFLQGDVFNMTWNSEQNSMSYMNYASLGFTLGHEMGHAFDPFGILFDDVGKQRHWMKNETEEIFEGKYQCLREQYSNLTDPETGLNCNGSLTITENFADNGKIFLN